MFRILFIALLLVPLIEIYLLIKVANVISAAWTLFAVVATAIVGAGLLRQQGASTLLRARMSLIKGQVPAMEMLEGIILVMSGVMLLTPGFVTDTIGFVLLIPTIRQWLIRQKIVTGKFNRATTHQNNTTIIEGEIVDDQRLQ